MSPVSILMFCFSGALLLYAAVLALTKDASMIPRDSAAKMDDKKQYAVKFAKVLALAALVPANCGIIALFSEGWGLAALIVEMILALWVGTHWMK